MLTAHIRETACYINETYRKRRSVKLKCTNTYIKRCEIHVRNRFLKFQRKLLRFTSHVTKKLFVGIRVMRARNCSFWWRTSFHNAVAAICIYTLNHIQALLSTSMVYVVQYVERCCCCWRNNIHMKVIMMLLMMLAVVRAMW